jgi:hypothetical protein
METVKQIYQTLSPKGTFTIRLSLAAIQASASNANITHAFLKIGRLIPSVARFYYCTILPSLYIEAFAVLVLLSHALNTHLT